MMLEIVIPNFPHQKYSEYLYVLALTLPGTVGTIIYEWLIQAEISLNAE